MRDWAPWLLAAGAVAALAALGRWRWRRRDRGARPRGGEIWWARVPYADGTGAKLRPCLVLRRNRRGVTVLKITSQDKSHRRDHILIPTRDWDPWARRDSYLNLGEPILVRHDAFQKRAGHADAATMRQARAARGGPARRARPEIRPRRGDGRRRGTP
jgi:mRNA-degrading endonuclease toxin of MazEF toxin-antitoxin module